MCIEGGYKTVTPTQIANCLGAYGRVEISYRAVRVYFACLALVAVREAARRTAKKRGVQTSDSYRYKPAELCSLTGLKGETVNRELKRLERAKLLTWTKNAIGVNSAELAGNEALLKAVSCKRSPLRPIPIPRIVLRFISSCPKQAIGKTVLAHVVRGLSIDRKDASISCSGTVKASWIADAFGLSLRSVKGARKRLIAAGLVTKDTGSFQRKLNRDGAFFRFNCAWRGEAKNAPRTANNEAKFAPPYKDLKTSYEFKNQKAESRTLTVPGICKSRKETKPNLRNVGLSDLKTLPRVIELFTQGTRKGWAHGSEAELLNWTAAAVRALRVKARDPVRVFIAIVKGRRWELITQRDEDRARATITKYREKFGRNMFHGLQGTTPPVAGSLRELKF